MREQPIQHLRVAERAGGAQLRRQLEAAELAAVGVDEDVRAEDGARLGVSEQPVDLALHHLRQVDVVRMEDADEVSAREGDAVVRVTVDTTRRGLADAANPIAVAGDDRRDSVVS